MARSGVIHTADHDPLEPLRPLDVAIELIPYPSMAGLYQFLSKNKDMFPAHYRATTGYALRLLYMCEIEAIRNMTIREAADYPRFRGSGRPRGHSIIDAMIARAQR